MFQQKIRVFQQPLSNDYLRRLTYVLHTRGKLRSDFGNMDHVSISSECVVHNNEAVDEHDASIWITKALVPSQKDRTDYENGVVWCDMQKRKSALTSFPRSVTDENQKTCLTAMLCPRHCTYLHLTLGHENSRTVTEILHTLRKWCGMVRHAENIDT